jgi:hypothetical protein
MKSSIFWDVTPCILVKVLVLYAPFLLGLLFNPEDGCDTFF